MPRRTDNHAELGSLPYEGAVASESN